MADPSFVEQFWAAEDRDFQFWQSRRCNNAARRKLDFNSLLSNEAPTDYAAADVCIPSILGRFSARPGARAA